MIERAAKKPFCHLVLIYRKKSIKLILPESRYSSPHVRKNPTRMVLIQVASGEV
jgi:hypothetical protein